MAIEFSDVLSTTSVSTVALGLNNADEAGFDQLTGAAVPVPEPASVGWLP
jgi:hypothetical protein